MRYRQVPVGSFSTDTSVTDLFLKPVRMHEYTISAMCHEPSFRTIPPIAVFSDSTHFTLLQYGLIIRKIEAINT